MQLEMVNLACPLCRRRLPASAAGHAVETKLCAQCQALVQTACAGVGSRIAASAGAAQPNATATRDQVNSAKLVEDSSDVNESFEQEPVSGMSFEPQDELKSEFFEDGDSDDRIHMLEADPADLSADRSFEHREELFGGATIVEANLVHNDHTEGQTGALTEQALDFINGPAGFLEGHSEEPPSISDEEAADPWENPLPPSEYSRNEWPMVVASTKRKSLAALRAPLAAVMLLAGAPTLYFLIYRAPAQQRAATADSVSEQAPAVAESPAAAAESAAAEAPGEVPAPSEDVLASADSKRRQTADRAEAGSYESSNAQGRFSLQAAAFPDQTAADELAAKLKEAGVPSYVVNADLARRGRWFRVRVGRFNTAEDAHRFAAEAQLRARAAGISLQLIVCQFERP